VAKISRFPVKSLCGESVSQAAIDQRGIVGDRLWAVRDSDGKFGSGKSTRRFREMSGLLDISARYAPDATPILSFPDGRVISGDDPEVHRALSAHVGRAVTLAREGAVSHFDEGPLHLVTTSSVDRLGELYGDEVDTRRVRANLVLDTAQPARFDDADWIGRDLAVGDEVVARVRGPMIRCVMLGLPQVGLPAADGLLRTVARANDTRLGVVLDVVIGGNVQTGDTVGLL
jgi:uncharacterized protein YcbX